MATDRVQSLGVGAITTFAGAVVVAQGDAYDAYVAIAGDSRALLFDRNGRLREKTALHNLGVAVSKGEVEDFPPIMALRFAGVLTRSIGGMPERVSTLPQRLLVSGWLPATVASMVEALGRKRSPQNAPVPLP